MRIKKEGREKAVIKVCETKKWERSVDEKWDNEKGNVGKREREEEIEGIYERKRNNEKMQTGMKELEWKEKKGERMQDKWE